MPEICSTQDSYLTCVVQIRSNVEPEFLFPSIRLNGSMPEVASSRRYQAFEQKRRYMGGFGGDIYKSDSPIKFLLAYVSVGSVLVAFVVISVFGCMGRLGQ